MEWIPLAHQVYQAHQGKARQRIGALILSGIIAATSLTQVQAATQGTLGHSSSGSFTITLVIHPSLQSQVAIVDESVTDDEGNPVMMPTDTMGFDRPVSLCVSGRGLSRFSLVASGAPGVDLTVAEPATQTRLTGSPSAAFAVEKDCQNSTRKLIAQPDDDFQGSRQPAVLVIQAE